MRAMIDCHIDCHIEAVNYISLLIPLETIACRACMCVCDIVISVARLDCSNEVRNTYGCRYMHALLSL